MAATIIKDVKYITQTTYRPTEKARYKGLKLFIQGGKNRLCIHIEYDDGEEDYVPVFQTSRYTVECSDFLIVREKVEG